MNRRVGILLVCAGIGALQVWFWLQVLLDPGYLAHSDLYEQFLPNFLSPLTWWSSSEFAGLPVFADPQGAIWYPFHWLFAQAGHAWSAYLVSAYVVGGIGAALYAWRISGSYAAALVAGLAWPWSEAMADLFPHLAMVHGFAWLPWILFGLEQVVATGSRRWVGVTAMAFACLALSGHPQVSIYCGYLVGFYALVLWKQESGRAHILGLLAGLFALGGALAAIQAIPTVDAASWIARDRVGFGAFADSFAKHPHELLTTVIPQFCHERREAPTYVGLVTLWCAGIALLGAPRQWRTWFWATVALIGLLLGLGSLTPLASAAYHVPFYDKFRVVARHLALYSFAIIALAALAIGAARQGQLRPRRMFAALGTLAVGTGLALWFTSSRPDLFDFGCSTQGFGRLLPANPGDIWLQAAVAATACGILALLTWPRTRIAGMLLLPVALAADLLNAQSEPVDLLGFRPPTIISRALIQPSVHAARLRELTRPQFQRVLPVEGSALDPVLPGAFARLWDIPSLGGYNPLLPARLTRLAQMDANGAVRGRLLMPEDQTTDLFGVRYAVVRESALVWPATIRPEEPVSALPGLNLEVGPSDCRPKGPVQVTLTPPPGVDIAGIVVDWELVCEDNIPPGQQVGLLELRGSHGAISMPMRSSGGDPAAPGIRPLPEDTDGSDVQLRALQQNVGGIGAVERIAITTRSLPAWVLVRGLAVVGPDGAVHPLAVPQAALGVTQRWRESTRFRTSRDSDRGRDDEADDESAMVVYENLRARPRAWWVGRAVPVPDEQGVDAIRLGRLRDGTLWDVSSTALTMPDDDLGDLATAEPGSLPVRIQKASDGDIQVTSEASRAGLVVVSELHHPGWRARVDGQPVAVLRVDHAVMGVRVSAGRHEVTLHFEPRSLVLGAGVSSVAVLLTLWCLFSRGSNRPLSAPDEPDARPQNSV